MTELAILYLMVGLLSYWPALYFWKAYDAEENIRWYHFVGAWVLWCALWPIRYAYDLWYWWRAKK